MLNLIDPGGSHPALAVRPEAMAAQHDGPATCGRLRFCVSRPVAVRENIQPRSFFLKPELELHRLPGK